MLPQPVITRLGQAQFDHPRLGRVLRFLAGDVARGEGVIAKGPAAGMRINATGRNAGYVLGTSDFEEQAWLAENLRPGDSFWDLGANIGFFTLLASRLVGDAGAVVAFEPWPANVEQLRRNIALNSLRNVDVVEAAVAATMGKDRFVVPEGRRDAGKLGAAVVGISCEVILTTIDAEIEGGRQMPDVIKLDIEGAEIDALRGGMTMLEVQKPTLLVEVHWLGEAFLNCYERDLRPLGYAAETLTGAKRSISRKRERFHVVLRPQ